MSWHVGPRAWVPEENENRLSEFRTAAGYTLVSLAEKIGVGYQTLRSLELCASNPAYRDGRIKPWVMEACRVLRKQVEDVFPFEFCAWRQDYLTNDQVGFALMRQGPADIEDIVDARSAILKLYSDYPRYAKVLWAVCLGYSRDEVGCAMGISAGRVAQIEAKALRLLRSPARVGK